MRPPSGKLLRYLGQLVPGGQGKAVKDVLRSALSVLDPLAKPPLADPRLTCLAPPGKVPDLQALLGRNRGLKRKPEPPRPSEPGRFEGHTLATPLGLYSYKLYLPDSAAPPAALVVMLHGCTQNADDFAAGTRMNALGQAHNIAVVYPEQSMSANVSRCWNWFEPQNQTRDHGEAAVIAAITRAVMTAHGIEPGKAMVAGLSAGGAMAAVMAETYPDLYAAAGIHSGLAYRAAHDVGSAFAAMRAGAPAGAAKAEPLRLPVIVFQGSGDTTVNPENATAIVASIEAGMDAVRLTTDHGHAAGGRDFVTVTGRDGTGRVRFESWTIMGGGHAWSGGSVEGTYADPAGPDASAAMIRFFLAEIARRDAALAA